MNFSSLLKKISNQQDLSESEMSFALTQIFNNQVEPKEIANFLLGLRAKGESIGEITRAVLWLRELRDAVNIDVNGVVDIVGTGGDRRHTFNISTASAFVAAAAGVKIAKHGNRSISSKSGSADVLEAAGANLNLTATQIAECINALGIVFMFAPKHYPILGQIQAVRRELGVPTLFNILGPLLNPACVKHHVIGVYEKRWARLLAEVLKNLGSQRALLIYGEDCLDEISLNQETHVVELNANDITEYTITPEQFGINRQNLDLLQVDNSQQSLDLIKRVFANEKGPARDIVCLNAGAAIYISGFAKSLQEGVALAATALDSGAAAEKFSQFIDFSKKFLDTYAD